MTAKYRQNVEHVKFEANEKNAHNVEFSEIPPPKVVQKPTPKFDLKMIDEMALFRCCYRFSHIDIASVRLGKGFGDTFRQFGGS